MSEEQNLQVGEKTCKNSTGFVISIIALVFSVIAITLSSLPYLGNLGIEMPSWVASSGEKKVVISKQYDRGRSLAKARETKKPIVVFFYTDWCGFCQRFAPTFDKITKSKEIKKKFAVAFVNCEKDENRKDMQEFGVQGFPTVFVIKTDGTKEQLSNGLFFNDDSVEKVKEKMLEIIGE